MELNVIRGERREAIVETAQAKLGARRERFRRRGYH